MLQQACSLTQTYTQAMPTGGAILAYQLRTLRHANNTGSCPGPFAHTHTNKLGVCQLGYIRLAPTWHCCMHGSALRRTERQNTLGLKHQTRGHQTGLKGFADRHHVQAKRTPCTGLAASNRSMHACATACSPHLFRIGSLWPPGMSPRVGLPPVACTAAVLD